MDLNPITDICVIRSKNFLNHIGPEGHPECPERLAPVLALFSEGQPFSKIPNLCLRSASEGEIKRAHADELYCKIIEITHQSGWLDPDTYYSEESALVAREAAGSCIDLAELIWKGSYRRGFALVRPPGHHASRGRSMGFCLFNNVALAASAILNEARSARIAVVDFDLHHGNGTQSIFFNNPNVLFLSSHRYPFYPGSGNVLEVGGGRGKGANINFPLSHPYGDSFFLELYGRVVSRILLEYRPEMIIVSAGFDGHIDDPMQGFQIHTPAYGELAKMLIGIAETSCNGRILFCLEGGYHPAALCDSMEAIIHQLLDSPRKPFEIPTLQSTEQQLLENFVKQYQPFFETLA